MTLIVSDRRKRVTIKKDAAQTANVSTQALVRAPNRFSYVSGETHQHLKAVAGQSRIPESACFYSSLTIISDNPKRMKVQNGFDYF